MEKVRLIIFPHAGSGVAYYSKWRNVFSDYINVSIVQYPMREQKAYCKMPDTVQDLASYIFYEYSEWFEGKYAIWGHSMGSIVGYETLKLCQSNLGKTAIAFFSSGSSAPCDELSSLTGDIKTREKLFSVLRKFGGVSKELLENEEFMNYFLPVIKADIKLLSGYRDIEIQKILCPLILLEGSEDDCDITNWKQYVSNETEKVVYKGGHFFIENHQDEVIQLIEKHIFRRVSHFINM